MGAGVGTQAPQGISLEKNVEAAESTTHVTGRRIDFIVISLLCAGLALFAYDKWWVSTEANDNLALLHNDPRYEAIVADIQAQMETQLAQILEWQADREFEAVPKPLH